MAFLFNLFALCFLGKIIQTKVYAGLYHKVGLYSSQLQIKRATTFFCKVEWNSEIEFFCPSFVYNDCYAMYLSIWSHTHIWRLFEPFLLFVFHIHATIMCQEIVWEGFFSWSLSIFFQFWWLIMSTFLIETSPWHVLQLCHVYGCLKKPVIAGKGHFRLCFFFVGPNKKRKWKFTFSSTKKANLGFVNLQAC